MADDLSPAVLAARIAALERELASRAAVPLSGLKVTDHSHHPRQGTWDADSGNAECAYCGAAPIRQDPPGSDTPGRWRYGRETRCAARAAGAEKRH